MKFVFIVIGTLLLANGAFLAVAANFNWGIVLTIAAGVLFGAWGVFYEKIKEKTKKGPTRLLKYVIVGAICAEAVLVGFIACCSYSDSCRYDEDAVIVLGAAVKGEKVTLPLAYRLDCAAEYHRKNPDAAIVVTGGKGFQESVTEAEAMEKYLIKCGVSADKIIKEECATSTSENMRFSKEILDEYFGGDYTAVIITNNFHIYRAVATAKREGIENVRHMHAGLQWYSIVPCYLRESLAVLKMWAKI